MRNLVRILMMFAPMIIRQVNRFMRDRQRNQAQRPQQQRQQRLPAEEAAYDEYEEVYEEQEVYEEEVVDPTYKEDDFV